MSCEMPVFRDFPAELRAEIRADNCEFLDRFRLAVGESGEECFDPVQCADFFVGSGTERVRLHFSGGGRGAMFAYGEGQQTVIVVRHANELHEVDDPSSYVFPPTHVVTAKINDVVVFRSPARAFAVVKVLDVRKLEHGDDRNEVRFRWELRVHRSLTREVDS